MRKFLISAAALTFLAAPYAWGQPPDRGGEHGHEGQGQAERGNPAPQGQGGGGDRGRGPAPQAAMPPQNQGSERGERNRGPMQNQAPQMAIQAPPNRGEQNRDFNRGNRGQMENRAPQMAIQGPQNRDDQNRGGDNSRRMGFERRGSENRNAFNDNRPSNDFNRGGRSDFRAPNAGGGRHNFTAFRDFHRDFAAPHRFQVRSYRRPSGWYSHRWAFGEFLPAAFWARDYWLIDFADYDLPPPPYGAVWVRVDRDALLIDEDSGEIITVVYDVFY
jgi:Ni/Co efflux regulator RcnB